MGASAASVPDERAATGPSRAMRLVRGVVAMVLFTLPVLFLGFAVRQQLDPLIRFDEDVIRATTTATREHGLSGLFLFIQAVSQPWVVYILATAVCLWTWLRKGLRNRALWAFVTMMVSWNVGLQAKSLVGRARPVVQDPISHAPGYSFPSGHALNTMVVGAGAIVLGWHATRGRPWLRAALLGGATALVLLTGFDRVGLGVHYVSDVVGGWFIGLAVVLASAAAFNVAVAPAERDADEPVSDVPRNPRSPS